VQVAFGLGRRNRAYSREVHEDQVDLGAIRGSTDFWSRRATRAARRGCVPHLAVERIARRASGNGQQYPNIIASGAARRPSQQQGREHASCFIAIPERSTSKVRPAHFVAARRPAAFNLPRMATPVCRSISRSPGARATRCSASSAMRAAETPRAARRRQSNDALVRFLAEKLAARSAFRIVTGPRAGASWWRSPGLPRRGTPQVVVTAA